MKLCSRSRKKNKASTLNDFVADQIKQGLLSKATISLRLAINSHTDRTSIMEATSKVTSADQNALQLEDMLGID